MLIEIKSDISEKLFFYLGLYLQSLNISLSSQDPKNQKNLFFSFFNNSDAYLENSHKINFAKKKSWRMVCLYTLNHIF